MSNDRQLNYVNNLQNRDQNLYYVDDASELNSINLEENDKIYAINDNKLFQMEIVDQEEELSGSIVSFNGRNNTKIKSLVVNIEPQQDLHGYDNPWPAGGGINKANIQCEPFISAGVTISATNSIVTVNGTKYGGAYKTINFSLPAGTYYAKAFVIGGVGSQTIDIYVDTAGTTDNISGGTIMNAEKSFTLSADTELSFRLAIWSDDSTYTDYKIGSVFSTTPNIDAFAPYSNECPISGWTGAEIEVAGKNIAQSNNFSGEAFTAMTFNPALPAGNYVISYVATRIGSDSRNGSNRTVYDDNTYVDNYIIPDGARHSFPLNATKPISSIYIYSISGSWAESQNYTITVADFQLELGSIATTYESSQPKGISIIFPSEASTVYGGSDEVISGKLKSTMAMVDMGTLSWVYSSGYGGYFLTSSLIDRIKNSKIGDKSPAICSAYNFVKTDYVTSIHTGEAFVGTNGMIYLKDDNYTDAATFKSAISGIQLCYELAEPVEYITELQTLDALYGTNIIWADTDNITVKIAEKGITAFELKPHT